MDRKKINKELKLYINKVKEKINPHKIILYGSFARGEATEWSDIDLLVIASFKKINKDRRFDVLYDLQKDIKKIHSFHVYGVTPSEFKRAKPWTIFEEIKKEGITVFQS